MVNFKVIVQHLAGVIEEHHKNLSQETQIHVNSSFIKKQPYLIYAYLILSVAWNLPRDSTAVEHRKDV